MKDETRTGPLPITADDNDLGTFKAVHRLGPSVDDGFRPTRMLGPLAPNLEEGICPPLDDSSKKMACELVLMKACCDGRHGSRVPIATAAPHRVPEPSLVQGRCPPPFPPSPLTPTPCGGTARVPGPSGDPRNSKDP